MAEADTVTLGRAKRSTAGNRMRELLDQAHQQDEETLFAEDDNDKEFEQPTDVRDVFLDEFADTDEEVEDEDAVEREERRAARREAKGKSRHAFPVPTQRSSKPDLSRIKDLHLLDPSLDPSAMAPSSLILALRRQRRDLKRQNRSETLRSTLRASTLKTEEALIAKEGLEKPHRKGRRAQHETGEVRGLRPMTQDELIARALEEEERNKAGLKEWMRREEERRELRRVGRKRVKGPRWTWISRTVGRVEVIGDDEPAAPAEPTNERSASISPAAVVDPPTPQLGADGAAPLAAGESTASPDPPKAAPASDMPLAAAGGAAESSTTGNAPTVSPAVPDLAADTADKATGAPYTRNYLILSLPSQSSHHRSAAIDTPSEIALILGAHTDWAHVPVVPARNRPLHRRAPVCPITGGPAKYRDPQTGIGYATAEACKRIRELARGEYEWDEAGWWAGAVGEAWADGADALFARPVPEPASNRAEGADASGSEARVGIADEGGTPEVDVSEPTNAGPKRKRKSEGRAAPAHKRGRK